MAAGGRPIALPVFELTDMSAILLAMLGLAVLRTVLQVNAV